MVQQVRENVQELQKKVVSVARRYYGNLHRLFTDDMVLRDLIHEEKYQGNEPRLQIASLEKRVKLPPITKGPLKDFDFHRTLGDFSSLHLTAEGKSFAKQIASLLPSFEKQDEMNLEKRIHYFLSRVVLGRLPRNPKWLLYQKDIDHFTASLFLINQIARQVNSDFSWLRILHSPSDEQYPSQCPQLVSKPDSVLMKDQPSLIRRAKDEIGVAGYPPLKLLCEALNESRNLQTITYHDVKKITGETTSKSRYIAAIADLILTEHIIPIPHILGVRHRWVLTRKARKYVISQGLFARFDCRPYEEMIEARRRYKWGDISRHSIKVPDEYARRFAGKGLTEEQIEREYRDDLRQRGLSSLDRIISSKINLQETENRTEEEVQELEELELLEKKFKTIITREMREEFPTFAFMEGASMHFETPSSRGPQFLSLDAKDFYTEHEIISYRLDLFNNESKTWFFTPWKPSSPKTESNWIYFDTTRIRGKQIQLTSDDVYVMAYLWLNRGAPEFRLLLHSFIDVDPRLVAQTIEKLANRSAFIPLYYPSLEYSGLSEGVLIAIPAIDSRRLSRMKKWLLEISPFIHLYWSRDGSLAAKILVPRGRGGLMLSVINNEIMNKWKGIDIYLGSISQELTYSFTMPSKLFDPESRRWRDPWIS